MPTRVPKIPYAMVYFAQISEDSLIKIGSAASVRARMVAHRRNLGVPLCVLGVLDGDRYVERYIRLRFDDLRVLDSYGLLGYEWFRPDERLLSFIAAETSPWDGSDGPLDRYWRRRVQSLYRRV
jgi:hypothetical protein